MILKFIGKDGSMGLKHGKNYSVLVKSNEKFICVYWTDKYGKQVVCPYSSPQTLALNWEKA